MLIRSGVNQLSKPEEKEQKISAVITPMCPGAEEGPCPKSWLSVKWPQRLFQPEALKHSRFSSPAQTLASHPPLGDNWEKKRCWLLDSGQEASERPFFPPPDLMVAEEHCVRLRGLVLEPGFVSSRGSLHTNWSNFPPPLGALVLTSMKCPPWGCWKIK